MFSLMDNGLKSRIKLRLDTLDYSAHKVSLAIDRDRNYVADFLGGSRKKSFATESLPKLAIELKCDVGWLLSGHGEPDLKNPTKIDTDVIAEVVRHVASKDQLVNADPEEFTQLIVDLCLHQQSSQDAEGIDSVVDFAAARLKRAR